jgi:hypothetical protein
MKRKATRITLSAHGGAIVRKAARARGVKPGELVERVAEILFDRGALSLLPGLQGVTQAAAVETDAGPVPMMLTRQYTPRGGHQELLTAWACPACGTIYDPTMQPETCEADDHEALLRWMYAHQVYEAAQRAAGRRALGQAPATEAEQVRAAAETLAAGAVADRAPEPDEDWGKNP